MQRAFPGPEDLAAAAPEDLQSMGFNSAKTRELIGLAKGISSGQLDVEGFAALGNDEATSQLLELPGVGRWTAEYVLLRGMKRVDVFPGEEIIDIRSIVPLDEEMVYASVRKTNRVIVAQEDSLTMGFGAE